MASSSQRLQTKPVITCFKSLLLIYTFIFWERGVFHNHWHNPSCCGHLGQVAAIVGFVFRHEIKNSFKNNYEKALKQYNSTGDYRSEAIDKIQNMLHCCGVTDYRNWEETRYYSEKGFPKSCCKLEDCSPQKDADKVNSEGCFLKVMAIIESEMGVVAGISFGVACFQLIGIFLAYCLSHAITNNQYEIV
ncbi:tetraspanin-6 isoform X4 [Cavia porcellus]|uniref:tetraspanin-6 isoform X4 n=1 Tax=Cavia porcellus TaxID=10141 RepID=UPI000C8773D9|nr:tetraspanin-6 isoform X4 [Cavia porcellus]